MRRISLKARRLLHSSADETIGVEVGDLRLRRKGLRRLIKVYALDNRLAFVE